MIVPSISRPVRRGMTVPLNPGLITLCRGDTGSVSPVRRPPLPALGGAEREAIYFIIVVPPQGKSTGNWNFVPCLSQMALGINYNCQKMEFKGDLGHLSRMSF